MPYTIVLLVCLVGTEPPCPTPEAFAPTLGTAVDPDQAPDRRRPAARPGRPAERCTLRPGEEV